MGTLQPGGTFVAIDFDLGGCRAEPAVPLVDRLFDWLQRTFVAVGASPRIGARLGPILRDAGLRDVATFGVQGYLQPGDPTTGQLLGGVIRSLSAPMVAHGIATAEDLALETLDARIVEALTEADAVLVMPTVAGAWGRSSR
jgi:hypothetical protein